MSIRVRGVQCSLQLALNPPLEASTLARYRLASGSGGWMSYLTYGYYHGTDLRTDVNQWWMVGYAQGGYTWDDNSAHFTLDALDANGIPVRRIGDASGRLHREQWFAVVNCAPDAASALAPGRPTGWSRRIWWWGRTGWTSARACATSVTRCSRRSRSRSTIRSAAGHWRGAGPGRALLVPRGPLQHAAFLPRPDRAVPLCDRWR